MVRLYEDPWFTFRFDGGRVVPRLHLEGVPAGRRVSMFQASLRTGERLGLLAAATVGDEGWVDLAEPIVVWADYLLIAVPEAEC